jgi:8-oxo-dGTP pyrophosphatase MutT (NUDIX family)
MERFKIIAACYLILLKDGRILMLRRCNTGYEDGNYSLVAGHVDGGETFLRAMAREAAEEAGIIIAPDKLEVAHIMHRNGNDNNNERIDIFLIAREWDGDIKNMEPGKCDDLSWFDIGRLPPNTIPHVRRAIDYVGEKIFFSEYGF